MTDGSNTGGVVAEQLSAFVRRIERLEEEIGALNADKREVYSESKSVGFCKKTLRKVIMRRRKDKEQRNEEDHMLELYESALAGLRDPLE